MEAIEMQNRYLLSTGTSNVDVFADSNQTVMDESCLYPYFRQRNTMFWKSARTWYLHNKEIIQYCPYKVDSRSNGHDTGRLLGLPNPESVLHFLFHPHRTYPVRMVPQFPPTTLMMPVTIQSYNQSAADNIVETIRINDQYKQ